MISDEKRKALRAARPARKAAQREAARVARARGARKHGSHHRCTAKPDWTKPRGSHSMNPGARWHDPWYWAPDIVLEVRDTDMVHTCARAVDPDNGSYPTPARLGVPEERGLRAGLSWTDKEQHMGFTPRK